MGLGVGDQSRKGGWQLYLGLDQDRDRLTEVNQVIDQKHNIGQSSNPSRTLCDLRKVAAALSFRFLVCRQGGEPSYPGAVTGLS